MYFRAHPRATHLHAAAHAHGASLRHRRKASHEPFVDSLKQGLNATVSISSSRCAYARIFVRFIRAVWEEIVLRWCAQAKRLGGRRRRLEGRVGVVQFFTFLPNLELRSISSRNAYFRDIRLQTCLKVYVDRIYEAASHENVDIVYGFHLCEILREE